MRTWPLIALALSTAALALPESRLDTHTQARMLPAILDASQSMDQLKERFSRTLVPELDALWDSRTDTRFPGCAAGAPCPILTRLDGRHQGHPLVIFPGFTGYRKMYLETAYDLLQEGYGPVYILDFRGQGEGLGTLPTLNEFVGRQDRDTRNNFASALTTVAAARSSELRSRLGILPIGVGHIREFTDYVPDVNFALNQAAAENPGAKLHLHAHSTGALSLMLALGQYPVNAPWLSRVENVFLETPFLRNYQSDNLLKGWAPLTETIARMAPTFAGSGNPAYADRSVPDFVNKATGHFNPANRISHSENRLSLSDGIRTWNGFETAGATWGWVRASVRGHYDSLNPGYGYTELDRRLEWVRRNLAENAIGVVSVITNVDAFADSPSTEAVMLALARSGVSVNVCRYEDAKHGLHQESDPYRNPFLRLWVDQIDKFVRRNYARAGEQPLSCVPVMIMRQ